MHRFRRHILIGASLLAGPIVMLGRSYQYDDAGRLVLATYENGAALRYTYTFGNNIDRVERLAVPVAPNRLEADRVSFSGAILSWRDRATDETSYIVQRRSTTSSIWESVATLPASARSYEDKTLAPSLNYAYRVFATSSTDGLISAFSAESVAGGIETLPQSVLILIRFNSESNVEYQLQASSTLELDSWQAYPWQADPSGSPSELAIPGQVGEVAIYVRVGEEDAVFFRLMRMQ